MLYFRSTLFPPGLTPNSCIASPTKAAAIAVSAPLCKVPSREPAGGPARSFGKTRHGLMAPMDGWVSLAMAAVLGFVYIMELRGAA